ncbi:MAG TPA: HD-GYP domain-containing protein [Armatimonadota bacterium]|nr:HD-GYP domain-containing protein [Armatimonadota bacterium]
MVVKEELLPIEEFIYCQDPSQEILEEYNEKDVFHTLFQSLSEAIAIYRLVTDTGFVPTDYTLLQTNKSYDSLVTTEAEKTSQHTDILFPQKSPKLLDIYSTVVQTTIPTQYETENPATGQSFRVSVIPLGQNTFATIYLEITRWKNIERKLQQSLDEVNRSLKGAVSALSTLSAWRDPYTATHQTHVAELARKIATAMKLDDHDIEGIFIAGLLHDIGKIAIPIEILCKPGKITKNEFNIIKDHPQIGYDVLHGIHFPWPIADIIRQHHERLNGSGYPAGLERRDIMLSSRILAVADVVEAISSHRPYRPSLGLDTALEEITRHVGEYYDADVVNACLEVCSDEDSRLSNT